MMIDKHIDNIKNALSAYINAQNINDIQVSVAKDSFFDDLVVRVYSKNYGNIKNIPHIELQETPHTEIFALILKPMVDEVVSKEKGSSQVSTFNSSEELVIKSLKRNATKHAFRLVEKLGSLKGLNNQIDMGKIIIAGGCFVSWFHNEELNDIDVFYLDDHNTSFAGQAYIGNAIANRPNSIKSHEHYTRYNDMIKTVFTEQEADTMFDYQYIFTKYKTRRELVDHFDLAHATISYNIGEAKLYITRQAYDALKNKKLVRNDKGDIAEWRIEKFLKRGWTKDKDFDKQAGDFFNSPIMPVSDTFSTFASLKTPDELLKKMAAAALGS